MIFCKLNRNIIQKSCLHNGNNTGKDAQQTESRYQKKGVLKQHSFSLVTQFQQIFLRNNRNAQFLCFFIFATHACNIVIDQIIRLFTD